MTFSSKLRFLRLPILAAAATAAPIVPAHAQAVIQSVAPQGFDAYLQTVAARARREGVSEPTIAKVLTGLTPNQRVVELDSAQPNRSSSPPPIAPYIAKHVGSSIIARGRDRYAQNASILPAIEQRYGVPAKMLFAIWGHETNFGSYVGDFDLARSLATLAWEGRRRQLFENELIELMKMVDQGVPTYKLKGSWAGAFGYPQFLPSVYLRLAADGDGNGTRDIFSSPADTLASIANYFRDAGWRPGQPWGVRASLPASFSASDYASKLSAPTCAAVHARHGQWKSVAEWRALGVTPLGPIGDQVQASLFQPDGPGTSAYLLTGNYRVILQYNCSNYYALSVGLLADEIAR
ncbi:lytic transglycosylase domain-containing protein [Novosphingobium sp. KA1]|uniref:lytic murein transglycosylase n=1 Tax=Novosphingobium sp. (strain KA1) TaxID=164608 RepID=UPI001A8CA6EB|nr:lytic murein transglycosylase [Novosphingobium sp. KA1]QSR18553.1 lytic transglycosylase [Novosphingobium sp. KA1]